MIVQPATVGARGVDCITIIDAAHAARLRAAGIDFAVRYLGSLTQNERDAILGAGMALLAVGFSRKPGWSPHGLLGAQDGGAAVVHAQSAGLSLDVHLFCDLEGPKNTTTAQDCIDYVNEWSRAVQSAGYRPGLYVGFGVPLTSRELYDALVLGCYWHSGSDVPDVATRGYCMRQEPDFNQWVAGVQVDVDVVTGDRLGGVPNWLTAA